MCRPALRRRLPLGFVFATLFAGLVPAWDVPGALDPGFGTGGKVTTDFGGSGDYGYSVAVQSDGKIIVAGYSWSGSNYDFALVRYTTAGALDPGFGTGGRVTTDFGYSQDYGYSVVVQSDGKIIVAGKSLNVSNDDFAVVRYTAAGALDPSFGTGGKVTTDFASRNDVGTSVAVHSDGKIIVAGKSGDFGGSDFVLVRYTAAGALDPSFGMGGKVTTDFGGSTDQSYSVAVQSDGKIIVAGYSYNGSNNDFALVRYTAAGALDPSFGTDGKVTTDFGGGHDYGFSVAVQSDGKIIVAGFSGDYYNYDFVLVRYTAAGALDPSFGTGGKVITDFGGSTDSGYSVAVQSDGKIIVAGESGDFGSYNFALARYTAAGALDPSFGTAGKVTTDFGSGNDYGRSVAVQSDGKIIVAGYSYNGSNDDFALVRYVDDPPPLPLEQALDTTGRTWTTGGDGNWAGQVAVTTDGVDAAQSGAITRNQTNWMETTVTGPGTLSFWWKVSSESGHDFLGFSSNGVEQSGKISGEVDWTQKSYELTASGPVIVRWSYSKDGGNSSGADAGWVDQVAFVPAPPASAPLATTGAASGVAGTAAAVAGTVSANWADATVSFEYGATTSYGSAVAVMPATVAGSLPTAVSATLVGLQPLTPYHYRVKAVNNIGTTYGSDGTFTTRATLAGDLDLSFGTGGKVTTPIGSGDDLGKSVAVQSDGKIIVAGFSSNGGNDDFALVRYTAAGALDPSFGTGGKVTTDFGSGTDQGYSVAVQSDGKIIVAGYTYNGSDYNLALVRYTTAGALDPTFGTGGKVTTPIGSSTDVGDSVAVQSDGKILVAGYSYNGSSIDFALVRYTAAGALDPSFGTGGKVTTDFGGGHDYGYSVAVQSDGKILVAGFSGNFDSYNFALVRYTAAGALDPSFGTGGKVTTDFGSSTDYGVSVAVQGDGKIIVTGYFSNGSNDDLALARYTTAGALDPGFGTGGKVITAFGSGTDQGYSVAVQGDGKIIVAGYTANGSNTDFALVRYTAAGALDPSFGTGGKVTTDFGSGNDYGRSVAVQSDGKIIVAGEAWNGSNTDFALVRYEGVAAPVLTAQPQSQTVPAGTNVTFTASATGTSPSYFWRKDGAFLPTATNLSLTVSNVTRAASGDYSVILTNASGSVTSAPALLRVLVPQRVEGGTNLHRLPDGRFQLHFRDPDGTLASDLTRLEIHSTTNFTGAGTVWVTNTTGLSIINGLIRFEDASSTNLLRRFYRVIEK